MSADEVRPTLKPGGTETVVPEAEKPVRTPEAGEALKPLGIDLMTHLFSAVKTIRLYDINNRAAQRTLGELHETVTELLQGEERAELRVTNNALILNDCRISVDARHFGLFEFLVEEMHRRDVEGIDFCAGVTPDDLGKFLKLLFEVEITENVFESLEERITAESISTIAIAQLVEREQELVHEELDSDRIREESNRVYFRTVSLMGDILRTIEEKHMLHVKKAKRLTQQMVDIIQTDESLLVGLASIKNFDEYTFAHSVNVCILSMVLADRLQLDKTDVARVGVCGLFHDIGKTYVPSSIINSSGALNPKEWKLMKYHTIFGVKELSRTSSLRDAVDSMFAALQHHVHCDMNGYPRRPGGWRLRLFSRIVTVADYYDAMTAKRSYQQQPVTPDKALRFILEKSGTIFDPFVSKVFIQTMGLYPIGTIVELDTGETAVVVRQNKDARYIHRPQVEIVDKDADPSAPRETADLTERSSGEFRFRRSVVRTIHDSEIEIDKRVHFIT